MKAILRLRFAVLLALLTLPFLFNSCSPYYDQAYYGNDGYPSGAATVYHGSSNYYRPVHVPVVASRFYVSSGRHRCSACSYSPCRCSNHRSHAVPYHTSVQHPSSYRSKGHRPSNHVVHSPSINRGYGTSSHGRSSSANRGSNGRSSSPSLHRNSSPSKHGSGPSSRYTTTSTNTPSPRRSTAVPSRTLKPQATTRPSSRANAPTRTSRPTTSRPTTSRPTTSRPTTPSRPSSSRSSSSPAPTRKHSTAPSSSPKKTKPTSPAKRGGKYRG